MFLIIIEEELTVDTSMVMTTFLQERQDSIGNFSTYAKSHEHHSHDSYGDSSGRYERMISMIVISIVTMNTVKVTMIVLAWLIITMIGSLW